MSKKLYNIFVNIFRLIPSVQCILSIITSILCCFEFKTYYVQYFCGISFCTLAFYYIASYLFKFCWKHRLCIHYLSFIWLWSLLDITFKIPIDDLSYLLVEIIVFILMLMYYVKRRYFVPN